MWPSIHIQDIREIPTIVNEKIVITCSNFHTYGGGTSLVMALANRQTDRFACLEQFFILDSYGIFLKNILISMSLGLVVLEEKLFTHTPTLQSDDQKNPEKITSI